MPAVELAVANAQEAFEKQVKEKAKKRKAPWADWGQERKKKAVDTLQRLGYKALNLELGSSCPPRNTVKVC